VPKKMIVTNIPGGGRLRGGGHWTRDVVFSLDGKKNGSSPSAPIPMSATTRWKEPGRRLDTIRTSTGFSRLCLGHPPMPWGWPLNRRPENCGAQSTDADELGDDLPPDYITPASRKTVSTAGRGITSAIIRPASCRQTSGTGRQGHCAGRAAASPFASLWHDVLHGQTNFGPISRPAASR